MTTMTEVQKTSTQSSQNKSVSEITGILLSDGWHNTEQCEKIEFSVSASPATDGPYTYLKYQDPDQRLWNYVPFSQIQAFQFKS